jgi:hypothetical protein
MLPTTTLEMTDISRQRRFRQGLDSSLLSPRHTVGQAVETYREQLAIPGGGNRWAAISRGKRLDMKSLLADVPEELNSWTVMPEISAGGR